MKKSSNTLILLLVLLLPIYAGASFLDSGTIDLHDYLVPVRSVPEPARLLLLGFGLMGLAEV